MDKTKDLAIVLRWVAYEERHRVITALTEQRGRVSALARNSIQSRRFGGALEPFSASEWTFVEKPGADLLRLDGAEVKRAYEGLRADFRKLSLASVWNELMIRVAPEREPCPELFRLHANALAALEETPTPLDEGTEFALLNAYFAKVLQWSGNQPQLGACVSCEKPLDSLEPREVVSCRVSDASWICASCRKLGSEHVSERDGTGFGQSLLRVSHLALRDFLSGLSLPIRQVPEQAKASVGERRALFAFLEALCVYHLPGLDRTPLKSLRFVLQQQNH